MPKYIAFLRAINVGGHTVKMPVLQKLFEQLGYENVETFIASGNVIFDGKKQPAKLEKEIEKLLQSSLGYEVKTFLRTPAELAEILKRPALNAAAGTLYVGFMQEQPHLAARKKLVDSRTAVDEFAVKGREVYWLCTAQRFSDSLFNGAKLEKTIGTPVTMRNMNTVERLVKKYGDA